MISDLSALIKEKWDRMSINYKDEHGWGYCFSSLLDMSVLRVSVIDVMS